MRLRIAYRLMQISLTTDLRLMFIWRIPWTHYNLEKLDEQHRYDDAGLLVLNGISLGSWTALPVQNEPDLLVKHYTLLFHLFQNAMDANFIISNDNIRSHQTSVEKKFVREQDITR